MAIDDRKREIRKYTGQKSATVTTENRCWKMMRQAMAHSELTKSLYSAQHCQAEITVSATELQSTTGKLYIVLCIWNAGMMDSPQRAHGSERADQFCLLLVAAASSTLDI